MPSPITLIRATPGISIQPGKFVQLGIRPRRIDILHEISGIEFSEVWSGRVVAEIEGLPVNLIGREALIKNKKAAGRDKDLADLRVLEVRRE